MVGPSKHEWKLRPDDLWFRCTQDSGLIYRYDGEKLHRLIFSGHRLADEFMAKHLSMNHPSLRNSAYSVYTIYKDSRGNVWFGTAAAGACRYDGKSFDWITETDVSELHDGPSNGVRSIIEDKDGYFWFNTMYRYNIYGSHSTSGNNPDQEASWYTREKSIGSLDGREDGDLTEYLSIARDNHDALWFATYRDGVWRYDGKKITHFPVKDGSKDITLFTIYKDHAGDLFLGTHETGTYKFNGKTFERFQ
jgi:ligand-binding sensor domain-containing protein